MLKKLKLGGQEFTVEEAQKMANAGLLGVGLKHDTSAATPSATPWNGPYPGNNAMFGLFSDPGRRPGIWNTTLRPRSFASVIPMFQSEFFNELIEVATGVTVGSGNNEVSACVVGPKPGQLKKAAINARFGIIHMSTKIFDITQAGMRKDRADMPREFYNQASVDTPWLPQLPGINGDGILASVFRSSMYELGIELERNVGQVHFVGVSGTENNTYRGVARQWNGLDQLVRTGWTDVDTGLIVPALDALVRTFGNDIDGGTDGNGLNIVAALIDAYYAKKDALRQMGITADFVLVMRPELFRALAAVWSCAYNTTRCISTSEAMPLVRDAVSTRAEYEAILNGQYLPMEGENVPVLIDDNIARETLGNGHYKSDIYGIALRGNGRPVVYGEYFNMANPQAEEIANAFPANSETMTVNDGLYRAFKRVTGGCYEFDFFARPRLITDAPFMHFRLDDLFYKTYAIDREALPGMSFYRNGGVTYTL